MEGAISGDSWKEAGGSSREDRSIAPTMAKLQTHFDLLQIHVSVHVGHVATAPAARLLAESLGKGIKCQRNTY